MIVTAILGIAVLALLWPSSMGGQMAYVLVSGESMEPTMRTGDLAIVRKRSSYGAGDIVAFKVPKGEVGAGEVVIHRVKSGDAKGYVMRGDNKPADDPWTPAAADVLGRRVLLIPRLGLVLRALASPIVLGLFAGSLAAVVVFTSKPRSDRNESGPPPLSGHADPSHARERFRHSRRRNARRRARARQSQRRAGTLPVHARGHDGRGLVVSRRLHPADA